MAGKGLPTNFKVTNRDGIPYDFVRKRLSVVVGNAPEASLLMVTKGALDKVLQVSTQLRSGAQTAALDETALKAIRQRFAD